MPKAPRARTTALVETRVLDRSRRRCTLCFHIDGDLSEKLGQIAHLDEDRSNSSEDNLAWMCLAHHSLYDSTTSQHKNYTIHEVKAARERLYSLVEQNQLPPVTLSERPLSSDKALLDDILELMRGRGTTLLKYPNFGSSVVPYSALDGLVTLAQQRHGPEYEFLDPELEELRAHFLKNTAMFLSIVQINTETVPDKLDSFRVSTHMAAVYPSHYQHMVAVLDKTATELYGLYRILIRSARKKLTP